MFTDAHKSHRIVPGHWHIPQITKEFTLILTGIATK